MQIRITKQEWRVFVTIMHLSGNLDASNYIEVINKAQELYASGVRDILIDLSGVSYVSSAGLMSLHTVVLIFAGQSMYSKETGRPSFRAINFERDGAVRQHVKLFGPQPSVEQVLDVVGLKQFFDVYHDLDAAIKSY